MRLIPNKISSNPLIRALLPTLRTVEAAQRELRWIQEELPHNKSLLKAVTLRGKGYPLQYILGTQPFGPLEIKTARKVLIPRWETEEWALKLGDRMTHNDAQGIKILDMCTGTGCVLFLLTSMTSSSGVGLDISPNAQRIFAKNQRHLNLESVTQFRHHDINEVLPVDLQADLVTANPPYIPFRDLIQAEPSVRTFEPRLALIGDNTIYNLCVARTIEANARAAVFEVGSKQQIEHTIDLFNRAGWTAQGQVDGAGKYRTVWAWKGSEWSFLKVIK